MRGTGYAIGEILIFLAIASIIGFLLGWLVFYRRPGSGSNLAPSNPNHVRQLEARAKAVESKMSTLDKKANALLSSLSKAPPPSAAATAAVAAGTADAKKAVTDKADQAKDKVEAKTDDAKKAVTDKADQAKDKVEAKTDDAKKAVTDAPKKPAGKSKDGVEGYLTEADDRISKLEETLDKLSEKLAELDDE